MSRVAKKPVDLPQGVTATIAADAVTVKGAKGSLTLALHHGLKVVQQDKHLSVDASGSTAEGAQALAGSARAHLANMVTGVSKGYEKKLELVGVGYRAAVAGKVLNLTLGFSHAIAYAIPEGITNRNHRQRPRSAESRSDGRGNSRLSAAGTLQGQGRQVFG
jgi:large subunit ribosomal protein L6